ncbi:hypothetical protein JHK85_051502 [Glycine max]|nr:hypothetical protein JHK86_050660 [Glycine max]KAG4936583.1 hypothetical protein JHK85_051502 [Glycine max]
MMLLHLNHHGLFTFCQLATTCDISLFHSALSIYLSLSLSLSIRKKSSIWRSSSSATFVVDGSKLVVLMDILDRWFKKFQEWVRRDLEYLKCLALPITAITSSPSSPLGFVTAVGVHHCRKSEHPPLESDINTSILEKMRKVIYNIDNSIPVYPIDIYAFGLVAWTGNDGKKSMHCSNIIMDNYQCDLTDILRASGGAYGSTSTGTSSSDQLPTTSHHHHHSSSHTTLSHNDHWHHHQHLSSFSSSSSSSYSTDSPITFSSSSVLIQDINFGDPFSTMKDPFL